jgi:hypothetical protein
VEKTMPKKLDKNKDKQKFKGILKVEKGMKKGGLKGVKRVQFRELNEENRYRLITARAQLKAMKFISTEANRAQEAAERLLWRKDLARKKAQSSEGILSAMFNGLRRLIGM